MLLFKLQVYDSFEVINAPRLYLGAQLFHSSTLGPNPELRNREAQINWSKFAGMEPY
jgi:hypothetical protein